MGRIITRKIKLIVAGSGDEKNHYWKQLWEWNNIVRRAANLVVTHHAIANGLKDMIYLNEGVKMKLAKYTDDNQDGMLDTSKRNMAYQVLSKEFKGEIKTAILSCVAQNVRKNFYEEYKEVLKGNKSLRMYRSNIPMPIESKQIKSSFKEIEGKCFVEYYGIPFEMYFGRDKSGERESLYEGLRGVDRNIMQSSIQIKKNGNNNRYEIFLNITYKILTETKKTVDPKKEAVLKLGTEHPFIIEYRGKTYNIGTGEEYMHRLIQIEESRKRLQKALAFNKGGKGRKKKLQKLETFKEKEKNYRDYRTHVYSRRIIDFCLKKNIGTIKLDEFVTDSIDNPSDDEIKPLIMSWSYFGMANKLAYKGLEHGIEIEK